MQNLDGSASPRLAELIPLRHNPSSNDLGCRTRKRLWTLVVWSLQLALHLCEGRVSFSLVCVGVHTFAGVRLVDAPQWFCVFLFLDREYVCRG